MAYTLNSAKDSQGNEQEFVAAAAKYWDAIQAYKRQHGGDLEGAFQKVTGTPWPAGRSLKSSGGRPEMTKDRTVKSVLGKYVAPIAAGVAAPFVLPALLGAGGAALPTGMASGVAGTGLAGVSSTIPASFVGTGLGTAGATTAATAAGTAGTAMLPNAAAPVAGMGAASTPIASTATAAGPSMWSGIAPYVKAGIPAALQMFGNGKSSAETGLEGIAGNQAALSKMISDLASKQGAMADPALRKAMQYYMSLAGGNRAQIGQAIAPDVAGLIDTYKGAERGLNARMAPGPQRDRSLALLTQQKTGQLGLMPMAARTDAMDKLAGMGGNLLQGANQLYGTSANALSGQANAYRTLAEMQDKRRSGWEDMGKSIFDIFSPLIFGKGK